jgi:hypothetical protein
MNTAFKAIGLTILFGVMAARAQSPPAAAPSTTSPDAPAAASSAKPTAAAPAPAPARAAKPQKASALSEAGEPRANTSAAAAPTSGAGAAAGRLAPGQKKGPESTDKLELGTATVTGDREQPKVMYIVPWKKSDIGDLAGKPMNSLVDEILAPVDRDVFKREVLYYKAVQADSAQNGAPSRPSQGEK